MPSAMHTYVCDIGMWVFKLQCEDFAELFTNQWQRYGLPLSYPNLSAETHCVIIISDWGGTLAEAWVSSVNLQLHCAFAFPSVWCHCGMRYLPVD